MFIFRAVTIALPIKFWLEKPWSKYGRLIMSLNIPLKQITMRINELYYNDN